MARRSFGEVSVKFGEVSVSLSVSVNLSVSMSPPVFIEPFSEVAIQAFEVSSVKLLLKFPMKQPLRASSEVWKDESTEKKRVANKRPIGVSSKKGTSLPL